MTLPTDPPGELGECLAIERRIDAAFEKDWSDRMDRRQGVCLSGEAAALVRSLPGAAADLHSRRARRAAQDLALAARRLSRIAASARRALDALDAAPE